MINDPNLLKFIHLTDCHLTGVNVDGPQQPASNRLRAAIDSINTDHDNADFVVITGDLTDRGDDAAYLALARELRRLLVPAHLLLGNHDDPRAFGFQFPDTQRCEYGFVQGSRRTPYGLCLFLDTSQKGSERGLYCANRRTWLTNVLEETEGPVMLFMHHPPFCANAATQAPSSIENSDDFWHVLQPHHHRIRHIFVGHSLKALFGNWRGISVSSMPGLSPHQASDTDRSKRVTEGLVPPAYGVVLANKDQLVVQLQPFANQ